MISPTYGEVTLEQVCEIINNYFETNKHYNTPFHVVIGTDSQNFSDTKVVAVIAVQCEGHGGIYFYNVERIERIQDVRQKLNYETQTSLTYADELIAILESEKNMKNYI